MAQKSLREFDAKKILVHNLGAMSNGQHSFDDRLLQVNAAVLDGRTAEEIAEEHAWLSTTKLVVKPDQLIKRRGNAGLLLLNADWAAAFQFISERIGKEVVIEGVPGVVDHFLVEPFFPHEQSEEMYVSISSSRDIDTVLFYHAGGVDIGDVDAKASRLAVPTSHKPTIAEITASLLGEVPEALRESVATFTQSLFRLFRELHFTLIEINPLVVRADCCRALDIAAKLDECGHFLCEEQWVGVTFPAPFGRAPEPDEAYIKELDSKTGASLKLTILNKHGRIWTMVAGGGASVVYADTISDLGFSGELANYGEYSGAPSEAFTYEYAKTVLKLMTQGEPHPEGKLLIIGGGIANFTDIASTFKGIVRALRDFATELKQHSVDIWVRRGGPNYQEGLRMMEECGTDIDVPMHVYGPKTDIVDIVPMGLGVERSTADFAAVVGAERAELAPPTPETEAIIAASQAKLEARAEPAYRFTENTRCIIYGLQQRACQGMLDFDFICKRERPSVAAFVFPFSGNHFQKFYFGTKEVLIPVFQKMEDALAKHPDVDIMVNFASFRSVHASTMEALSHPQLRCIAIIAEGVPEVHTRDIITAADKKGVMIVGPATVGGIKPGKFRIGNTGGFLDNIIASQLYRPGSVGYVSKSGGMSNELNSIISKNTNGVFEGVAIGGDRYPGTRFIDHLLRFNDDPDCKILVLLGEVGGVDEYEVVAALRSGRITKPMIAWCIGTCAKLFPYEVQFGHAGALAQGNLETSDAKNRALAAAGAYVPSSFADMGPLLKALYDKLVADGTVVPGAEGPVPKMPMDYATAKKSGLIRKSSSFISTICDDRGEELLYAGVPVSQVFKEELGVGGVVSLLWFRRRMPIYATKFIEMIMMVTADHGPAVSGAHNTIVCARAAKDLISSLCSGLLTIGPRFGGALDEAARMFSEAVDNGWTPAEFIAKTRKRGKLIMGIGHKIKSVTNPDMRVTIMVAYVKKHFKRHPVLDYALEVEKLTTKKKANLILNVDGAIACAFVDLVRECGMFDQEEAEEVVNSGCLNGLFVLGRSIGFIGHFLDQKRLKQGLYRHPWDDISYVDTPATPAGY